MNAQVAVYPVDAAGVGKNDHLASQHTANDLAQRTGGRAFHNTNDLAGSMQAGINDGGHLLHAVLLSRKQKVGWPIPRHPGESSQSRNNSASPAWLLRH